jgi:pyridinium-3,5-bisthiocarboxylic acid mononucleotide nickel chelatase
MKTLYLDLLSGISGDMFLGAMIDLGVDPAHLERELSKLGVPGYHLHVARQTKSAIAGVKFDVHLEIDHAPPAHAPHSGQGHAHPRPHAEASPHVHDHRHAADHELDPAHHHEPAHGRSAAEIRDLIAHSPLSTWVKERSLSVFRRVAEAEGKIHAKPADEVHFHEVGAVDSIVDIVGACLALEALGRPRVLASPVVDGRGWIECAHGRFPVPAPATLEILRARGISLSQCEEPHEMVTPTGAALLAEFAESFGPMQGLAVQRIGYGLGSREHQSRPNVLRAVFGESSPALTATHDWDTDTVTVLETNLDDINAELLGDFVERAFAAGALDVFHTAIQMKKNRPGVLLTVLCRPEEADPFSELVLRTTSAFGVRRYAAERRKLKREFRTVRTPFGDVTVKLGRLDGQVIQSAPEYESCRQLAETAQVPVKQVYEAALKALED